MVATVPSTAREGAGEDPRLSLELLVHGVGGTTPQTMLNDPRIALVTGDDTAGIYRRVDDVDAETRPDDYHGKPVPEAYSWCNLTSGDGSRALWLLLLPFMVVNLAYWMRPVTVRPLQERLYGMLTRLVALSLTVLLVAGAAEVAMDLVAWQCAGNSACLSHTSWLGFFAEQEPGRRLVAGALLPVAVTGLLWWLSHRTWYAYESQRPVTHDRGTEGAEEDPREAPLAQPGFWYGRRLVGRLRAVHTAAGLLTVAAALVGPALAEDLRTGAAGLSAAGTALAALLAALAAVIVAVTATAGRDEAQQEADRRRDLAVSRALLGGTATVLLLAAGHAGWQRPRWHADGRLPAGTLFGGLMLSQGVLVVLLGAVAWTMYRPGPGSRVAMRGLGGPAVALLGCALGSVLTGGVAQRVADWLDGGAVPGEGGAMTGPPVLLSWQASVIPILLLAVAVVVAIGLRSLALRTRYLEPEVVNEYPDEREYMPARTRRIAAAQARAGLTDRAPVLVSVIGAVSLLLAASALAGAWICHVVPGRAAGSLPVLRPAAEAAEAIGSWLIGAGVVALVALGRRAYRDTGARRTVGILWDVGTFWPRAAHPFAPPCYAERAVPDLTWRMTTWTRVHDGRIILSGHSQGSVLSAAAVWQLDRDTRRRVALLTYGSPLERLYGRWFPAYFGPQALRGLHGELCAWRNLWRRTDPIGGPVWCTTGPQIDAPSFTDPLAYGRGDQHPLPAPILAHSDYQADPRFAAERARLVEALLPGGAASLPAQGSAGRSSGKSS
jgi:hypothetical protein